jgi:hypothetical protein
MIPQTGVCTQYMRREAQTGMRMTWQSVYQQQMQAILHTMYIIYCWEAELCGVPSHVIMNQVGNLCNRYNHCIMGTNLEQNFIQRIVSQQCGTSHPLMDYISG